VTSDLFLLPSYCGIGDYARKATRSASRQTHGMVAFEIAYGQLVEVHPLIKTTDLRTKEYI